MKTEKLCGLIAATYTPLHHDGSLKLDVIRSMVDFLIDQGIRGLYVCGSTGEGMSLSTGERKKITEAFVAASNGRIPVIIQVGHNSLAEAQDLAKHAADSGADIISATCPSYFEIDTVETIVECMANIAAAAPKTPFYYYHIPGLTGSTIDVVRFLRLGLERIPTLEGLKYTDTKLFEFQRCLNVDENLDIVFGCDEMLLAGLATGARAAIGSTYNVLVPVYHRIISAFNQGDMQTARAEQTHSIEFIQTLMQFPFHSAMKEVLRMIGIDVGSCRLPQVSLNEKERVQLRNKLDQLGFFEWIAHDEMGTGLIGTGKA